MQMVLYLRSLGIILIIFLEHYPKQKMWEVVISLRLVNEFLLLVLRHLVNFVNFLIRLFDPCFLEFKFLPLLRFLITSIPLVFPMFLGSSEKANLYSLMK